MTPAPKRLPTFIFWSEIFFWLVVGYLGRAYFDQITANLTPSWLIWPLRLVLLVLILGLAIFIHGLFERFLKSKGISD